MNILPTIKNNSDLRALAPEQLPALCEEIRGFLIEKVSKTGGHLASNLGVVELTVAMHRVYDPYKDRLLFDVGHQSYVHKLLTGRMDEFDSLRQMGGLSGFPKPCESEADPFLAGHASDSVSVALGMARARTILNEKYDVAAIVGDGALTGGLSYEGLSDAGASGEPMVIVLNDNGMSINSSVGGVARLLSQARIRPGYLGFKRHYRKMVKKIPAFYRATHEAKEWVKEHLLPSGMFGDLGLDYIGPVDGHNVHELEKVLTFARDLRQPVLLHVVTVKGKGVSYAEKNPELYHGIGPFDPETGEPKSSGEDFSHRFGRTMLKLAEMEPRVCTVTAAMESGTGLEEFALRYPNRHFELGIVEGHAAAMCGGMARQGLVPVFAIYSSFLQRAYDMMIVDGALMDLHTVFAVDRAGLVGKDGVTHHGSFDAAYLDSVPGMSVYAPASFAELEDMLEQAVLRDTGPVAVRYPRGGEGAYKSSWSGNGSDCIREGQGVTVVSYGMLINEALQAADALLKQGISVEVIKLNRLSPLDPEPIIASVKKTGALVLVEEVCRAGSPGTRLLAAMAEAGVSPAAVRRLDLGEGIVAHGSVEQLRHRLGMDAAGIEKVVSEVVHEKAAAGSTDI